MEALGKPGGLELLRALAAGAGGSRGASFLLSLNEALASAAACK